MPNTFYVKYRGVITEATLDELKTKISSGEIGKLHKVSADKEHWEYASHHLQTGFRELDPASATIQAGQAPAPAPAATPAAPAPAAEPTIAPKNRQQCPSCLTNIVIPESNSGRIKCPRCDKVARINADGSLSEVAGKALDDGAVEVADSPKRSPRRSRKKQVAKPSRRWVPWAVAGLVLVGGMFGLAYILSPSTPVADADSDTGAATSSDTGAATSSDDPLVAETVGGGKPTGDRIEPTGNRVSNPITPARESTSVVQPSIDPDKGRQETLTNTLGMTLKLVRAGDFVIGSPATDKHRRPDESQRKVSIRKSFYLAAHEVKHQQFDRFVKTARFKPDTERDSVGGEGINENGERERSFHFNWEILGQLSDPGTSAEMPVVNVTRADAEAFCKWLSQEEGVTYRLPTEEEWEYACRAGTTTRYYNGDNDNDLVKIANVADSSCGKLPAESAKVAGDDRFARLAPVGQYQPNKLGLFDMLGNVAEWCSDDVNGSIVNRGGSWTSGIEDARSAARLIDEPNARYVDVGFRVLREVD